MNTVVSLVYLSGNISLFTFFSLLRMIESVPRAVMVSESSVSLIALSVISSMVRRVQYIIGRPDKEQSFSSAHETPTLKPAPIRMNIREKRIKFFIIGY